MLDQQAVRGLAVGLWEKLTSLVGTGIAPERIAIYSFTHHLRRMFLK